MEVDNKEYNKKYLRAKKRVDQLRGYYIHLAVFLIVNLFISISRIISDLNNGFDFDFEVVVIGGDHSLWLWWGIGLFFHTYNVFGKQLFFSKDWEDRKIKKFMDEK